MEKSKNLIHKHHIGFNDQRDKQKSENSLAYVKNAFCWNNKYYNKKLL
jgi:hypothetical protein